MTTSPAEPERAAAESTWVSASAELRSTAKWVIAALAAVATVIFGAGPVITRPGLDFVEDAGQLLLAFILGVAGLVGIGILIYSVSKVLLPVEMSLDDLPQDLLDKIRDVPVSLLPGGVTTLAHFRNVLASQRTAIVEIPGKIRDHEQQASEAQRAGDNVRFGQVQAAIAAYKVALEDTAADLATYEAVRTDLINRGAYTQLSQVFSKNSRLLWTGALLAGIGGLGFQLALTAAPEGQEAKDNADTSSVGNIAMLSSTSRAEDFWNTYGLAGCEVSDGQVPVLITKGAGTAESPYSVQTIPDRAGPNSKCPALTFVAPTGVFKLVVPEPDEIIIKEESDDEDE